MHDEYHVLIVEDDFRVAAINRQFVERVEGFTVIDTVKTGEEALGFLEQNKKIDLVLLDIYIPDVSGMDLFWNIRSMYHDIDIIIISAANETEIVEQTWRGGIFDYILKPADVSRFEQTLINYKQQKAFFASNKKLDQAAIDLIMGLKNELGVTSNTDLPKGIDSITLNKITTLLRSQKTKGITAVELSKRIGTSRSTARRYLEYLVSVKKIETRLKYGTVGRPEREYVLRETYEQNE